MSISSDLFRKMFFLISPVEKQPDMILFVQTFSKKNHQPTIDEAVNGIRIRDP